MYKFFFSTEKKFKLVTKYELQYNYLIFENRKSNKSLLNYKITVVTYYNSMEYTIAYQKTSSTSVQQYTNYYFSQQLRNDSKEEIKN